MSASTVPVIYQFKVHLIGISPMIWRRFQVSGDTTLSDLHYILHLVMGWSDYHLNCFVIHGKETEKKPAKARKLVGHPFKLLEPRVLDTTAQRFYASHRQAPLS